MGQLRGGTTIAGWPAIHSGMEHVQLNGRLTVNGRTVLNEALEVNNNIHVRAGGNVTFYSNYRGIYLDNTSGSLAYVRRGTAGVVQVGTSDRVDFIRTDTTTSTISMNVTGGDMNAVNGYRWNGQSLDTRYLRKDNDSYLYLDTAGNTTYGRITMGNNPSSSTTFIRTSGSNGGIIPYSNGTSSIGTTSWRFKEMHAVDFYEDGTKLSSKYASSSHSHSNYVTKNGDRMSGALEIEGTSNDSSRLTIFNTGTNPRNGGSLELLETGPKFGATNSNGFRIRYDGVGNELTVDSSYNAETRHLTIKRNGAITVSSDTNFNSSVFINSKLTDGYTTLGGSSIRFGPSNKGYIGDSSSGWVFFGNNNNGSTYLRIYDNGGMAQLTGSLDVMGNVVASGNVISGGDVRGILSHSSGYGYIHPFSASSYGADKSYLRYYYAGSGSSTNTSNRNELRISTSGNNAVPTRITMDGKTVPVVTYGTGGPPSSSGYRNGDIYIQY